MLVAAAFVGALLLPLLRPSASSPPGEPTMYPPPGTDTAHPATTVSLRGLSPRQIGPVRVVGTRSGAHAGTVRAHRDGVGLTFVPDRPFAPGERVAVTTGAEPATATFEVAVPGAVPAGDGRAPETPAAPEQVTAFHSTPEIVAPVVTASGERVPGLVLSTPSTTESTPRAVMITDADGELVWWRSAAERSAAALHATEWQGAPALAWFEGDMPLSPGWFQGEWIVVDHTYREVARVRAGNGLHADIHDLHLTDRGTAIVVAYQPVVRDATAHGGDARTVVLDAVVQEVDPATGDVWFEWHALDHIPLEWSEVGATEHNVFDYAHINAAVEGPTGDLLVTFRHTSMVTEIDRDTGRLTWVLGGRHPTVEVVDDRGIRFPHHARWRPDGTLSVFDNGVGFEPETSRGVVYRLDVDDHTATPVSTYAAEPPVYTATQGALQHRGPSTALASWGELGTATLFTDGAPTGTVDIGAPTYRILVAEWDGRPAATPRAAVHDGAVHVSWNGATHVARWELLRGDDAGQLRVVAGAARTGFETRLPLEGAGAVAQVRARDGDGAVLGHTELLPIP